MEHADERLFRSKQICEGHGRNTPSERRNRDSRLTGADRWRPDSSQVPCIRRARRSAHPRPPRRPCGRDLGCRDDDRACRPGHRRAPGQRLSVLRTSSTMSILRPSHQLAIKRLRPGPRYASTENGAKSVGGPAIDRRLSSGPRGASSDPPVAGPATISVWPSTSAGSTSSRSCANRQMVEGYRNSWCGFRRGRGSRCRNRSAVQHDAESQLERGVANLRFGHVVLAVRGGSQDASTDRMQPAHRAQAGSCARPGKTAGWIHIQHPPADTGRATRHATPAVERRFFDRERNRAASIRTPGARMVMSAALRQAAQSR